MNAYPFTTSPCPTCAGSGVQQDGQARLTCPTCHGSGSLLQRSDGRQLCYAFPLVVQPGNTQLRQYYRWLRYGVGGALIALTLASLGYVAVSTAWTTPLDLFWQKNVALFLFGVGGLGSMVTLARFRTHQTSELSLAEIETVLAKSDPNQPTTINSFYNPRFSYLLEDAATLARTTRQAEITPFHLLMSLFQQGRIQGILARLEMSLPDLVENLARYQPAPSTEHTGDVGISSEARELLLAAFNEAVVNAFPYVELEDLLLAYARTQNALTPFFTENTLTYETLYTVARWYAAGQEAEREWAFWRERGRVRPRGYMNRAWTALPTPFLDQFSEDITEAARAGVIAWERVRTKEIEATLAFLGGTGKRNVLLIGEPGSGRTTLLTALATRMLEERVPEPLKDKRLIRLDLSRLLTSSGTPETNLHQVMEEVEQAGNVILAIPEIKNIADSSAAALDAASVLATALQAGYVQVVSTATHADYHRYVEQNSLLASLLNIVELHELAPLEVVDILEEEVPNLEAKHGLTITYPALRQAAELASRYLPDHTPPGGAEEILQRAITGALGQHRKNLTREDVIQATEALTPVPIAQADSQEADKLLHLEEFLHRRVVGQDLAVRAVAEALRRARAGLQEGKRPIGSFLFVGPTGVGKTELAKALAESYFGSEKTLIRLDMSEFQEPRSIDRLIGPPALSAESATEGGLLTQPIRDHPFSLLLLDEIEKAHPDVLNLFLQILDDARVTENSGRVVHFENAIIIATSNAGSAQISQLLEQGTDAEQLRTLALQELEAFFKPEFLNRFDAIVPFSALGTAQLREIAALLIHSLSQKIEQKGIHFSVEPAAVDKLIAAGYNPAYGARPLRRSIEQHLENIVAEKMLAGELKSGDTLQISAEMVH